MDKQKLLEWIEMRISEHKKATDKIHEREFSQYGDTNEYHSHVGAKWELVYLRDRVHEFNDLKG